jgi:hypothetical protein
MGLRGLLQGYLYHFLYKKQFKNNLKHCKLIYCVPQRTSFLCSVSCSDVCLVDGYLGYMCSGGQCLYSGCIALNNSIRIYGDHHIRGGRADKLWLYKENNKLRDWENVFTLHIPPWASHSYEFVVLTSLTHPRRFVLHSTRRWNKKSHYLSTPLLIPDCAVQIFLWIYTKA